MTQAPILTLNGGSSSLKFAVFAPGDPPVRQLSGNLERIGHRDAALSVREPSSSAAAPRTVPATDHAAALRIILDELSRRALPPPAAIGHRIVHGGQTYVAPAVITPAMLTELHRLSPLAREHLPAELAVIESCAQTFPNLPQVACFDTAFHRTLPAVARLLPLPRRFAAQGVRRYGFHGLSYTFLLAELQRLCGPAAARGRHIFLHLGNGASLAAVKDGACIDTSMGFTPTAGLVMGTRTGELDPGLFPYLLRQNQMSADQLERLLNHESGLLGISETSSDMRQLLAQEASDSRAAEAIELFCYQAKKWLGAYAAALGGVDTVVFSGGIGEHAPAIRARICAGLEFLGIAVDKKRNDASAAVISSESSKVAVRVIPTDEERVIAESVYNVLASSQHMADDSSAARSH